MSHQSNVNMNNDADNGAEENPWRSEIVSTIFGDVGTIMDDFSCAIQRHILLQGRLYVTDRFLCFYSNLFGFEKKVVWWSARSCSCLLSKIYLFTMSDKNTLHSHHVNIKSYHSG
jgi:hypothetical protein